RECQGRIAAVGLGLDAGVELAEKTHLALVAEPDHVADRGFPGRLEKRVPVRAVEPPVKRRLHPRLDAFKDSPVEARRDDLGVVQHDPIAGPQEIRQLAHDAVLERPLRPHDEQPRGVARICWAQRDTLARQLEIEQVGAHWCFPSPSGEGGETRKRRAGGVIAATPPRRLRRRPSPIGEGKAHASASIRAETIRSGSRTGSPRLILSMFSMPATALPHTVYWPLSHRESAKQMKN